jgi:hypothetical protein
MKKVFDLTESEKVCLDVPAGWLEETAYVPAHRIRLGDTSRIDPAALREVYNRIAGVSHHSPGTQLSPCPKGFWEKGEDGVDTFVIVDGRHRFLAYLMLGYRHILVRWNVPNDRRK